MLINLYGNIINPKAIMRVTLSTSGGGYNLFFSGVISATAQDSNILEISAESVQAVDGLDFHDTSILYMQDMINKLERLVNTSAKKEIDTDGQASEKA